MLFSNFKNKGTLLSGEPSDLNSLMTGPLTNYLETEPSSSFKIQKLDSTTHIFQFALYHKSYSRKSISSESGSPEMNPQSQST